MHILFSLIFFKEDLMIMQKNLKGKQGKQSPVRHQSGNLSQGKGSGEKKKTDEKHCTGIIISEDS